MMTNLCIRRATLADAEAISHVIIQTLKEVSSKDYPDSVINEVIKSFSKEQITVKMKQRKIIVITEKNHIIGTASLEGNLVRTVFVLPNKQGKKAGSLLMHYLEEMARKESISSLTVSSSITAEGFYQKLGYSALSNEYYGEERTIIMEKKLSELP
ncbi:GNAT family N-acetyltransferase [Legionella worsleiensis]|uniref:Putative acyltransferase n=1 Tax=Legionella worsleiensis TaxID=45076 RepID=A0A0W1AKS3_9GAMM|nr:GNAT family N-acetyltransferase [Legionella worsleiensis]KTD81784.1 putative acyltransferase [Legionella worsleiensis]STY31126.1 putative acyltransferase [Legionella worsleiensis]